MIKLFEQFNNYNQVKSWLDEMGINNYTINNDLTVDVEGNVFLQKKLMTEIPVQFGKVYGSFTCSNNNLTTLKGCPDYVTGVFSCNNNELTHLDYLPKYMGSDFYCNQNNLTTLKGCPDTINGTFDCTYNKLTNTKYFPQDIKDYCFHLDNPYPKEIAWFDSIFILVKYQDEYGIWNSDGTLNLERFNIFKKDYDNKLN